MKFEENSHCTFNDRIKLVSKEILSSYPNIRIDDALDIAILDEPINKPADNDVKFMRYYYMLLILHKQIDIRNVIYFEMLNLKESGLIDDKLLTLFYEIEKYLLGERNEFPIVSEVYGY